MVSAPPLDLEADTRIYRLQREKRELEGRYWAASVSLLAHLLYNCISHLKIQRLAVGTDVQHCVPGWRAGTRQPMCQTLYPHWIYLKLINSDDCCGCRCATLYARLEAQEGSNALLRGKLDRAERERASLQRQIAELGGSSGDLQSRTQNYHKFPGHLFEARNHL